MARTSLYTVLAELGLSEYQTNLDHEAVDLEALVLLGATDLRSVIGLPLGHAAKLIARAQDAKAGSMNNEPCSFSPASADLATEWSVESLDDAHHMHAKHFSALPHKSTRSVESLDDAPHSHSKDFSALRHKFTRSAESMDVSTTVSGKEPSSIYHRSPYSEDNVEVVQVDYRDCAASRTAPLAQPPCSSDEGPVDSWDNLTENPDFGVIGDGEDMQQSEAMFHECEKKAGDCKVKTTCDTGKHCTSTAEPTGLAGDPEHGDPSRERIPVRNPLSSWFRGFKHMTKVFTLLDYFVIADHQWSFKLCLIYGQSNEAVKAHFLHMAEIWTIVFSVLLGSIIEIWGIRPNEGVAQELVIFECLVGSSTALTMITIFSLAVLFIVTSSVHPNNIKCFLVGIAGPLQTVETLINVSGYSLMILVIYTGWLRMHVIAPDFVISRWIVPVCTYMITLVFMASSNMMSKLAMHGGLMSTQIAVGSPTEIGSEAKVAEADVFERVWAEAKKTPSVGGSVMLHFRAPKNFGPHGGAGFEFGLQGANQSATPSRPKRPFRPYYPGQ